MQEKHCTRSEGGREGGREGRRVVLEVIRNIFICNQFCKVIIRSSHRPAGGRAAGADFLTLE